MTVDFFSYELPKDRIATRPTAHSGSRSDAKLLHARRNADGKVVISDKVFRDLPDILKPGDLLVLNDTKVIPSRFFVKNLRTGGDVEVLLLAGGEGSSERRALGKPLRKLQDGDVLEFSKGISAKVLGREDDGRVLVLEFLLCGEKLEKGLSEIGIMPIPPYIRDGRADEEDKEFYQTVFAKHAGSIAAPTAGLHFTKDIFSLLVERGIDISYVTLHVGRASFQPVTGDVNNYQMPVERFSIPRITQERIKKQKEARKRVIAVGTTVTRTLESWAKAGFSETEDFSQTELFIKPGFNFKVVDSLITNFHQPQTTHLLLVSALFGTEEVANLYQHALAGDYRFLSYGDSMYLELS